MNKFVIKEWEDEHAVCHNPPNTSITCTVCTKHIRTVDSSHLYLYPEEYGVTFFAVEQNRHMYTFCSLTCSSLFKLTPLIYE